MNPWRMLFLSSYCNILCSIFYLSVVGPPPQRPSSVEHWMEPSHHGEPRLPRFLILLPWGSLRSTLQRRSQTSRYLSMLRVPARRTSPWKRRSRGIKRVRGGGKATRRLWKTVTFAKMSVFPITPLTQDVGRWFNGGILFLLTSLFLLLLEKKTQQQQHEGSEAMQLKALSGLSLPSLYLTYS